MKHVSLVLTLLIVVIGFSVKSANHGLAQSAPVQNVAHVGVLAYRGVKLAETRWKSLEAYLSNSIPGWRFKFVPVTLASTARQIENREIDFLITNPGHYVTLQKRFRIAAIATRERLVKNSNIRLLKFGTAIFTRADSNVHSLSEIKGRTLAAVSPDAFGGFQIAWHEFTRQNIDLYQDAKSIRFMGFPQDAIITAVKQGDVDVGVVRSGLLELVASEKRIKLKDFRVIEGNAQFDYPYKVSSRLYPEWPFASMPATDKKLSESVLRALLATQKKPVFEKHSLHDLWSVPLSYNEVRILVSAYHQRNTNGVTSYGISIFQSPWVLVSAILLFSLLTVLIYLAFLIRKQQQRNRTNLTETSAITDPTAIEFSSRFDTLTKREREVLCMICRGFSSKGIAEELGVSTKTIEFHRANLLQKTDAGTTPHLVQLATKLGFDTDASPLPGH